MSTQAFNLFVIAPKDDPLLRARWRDPLPAEYLAELSRLVAEARSRGIEIAWSLSPGLDLQPGSQADLDAAASKFTAVHETGVRQMVLAFDDVDPDPAQFRFAARLRARLDPALAGVEWTFVPTEYWSDAAPSAYLSALARRLGPSWKVGWTGPGILPQRIDAESSVRFRDYVWHDLVLGDNYPVQDRVRASGRLFLGPLRGREPGLSSVTDAFLANASPLPYASRLPLATIAEYARDPRGYDAEDARGRAAAVYGAGFATFAAYNVSSWLDPGPGEAAERLASFFEGRLPRPQAERVRAELDALARLRGTLARELGANAELLLEVDPWVFKLQSQALAAQAALEFRAHPDARRRETFLSMLRDSQANPAVVAGQNLDRFLCATQAQTEGREPPALRPLSDLARAYAENQPGAREPLARELDRLSRAGDALEAGGADAALRRDAMPWVGLLSDEASRARDALRGRPSRRAPWHRWRERLRFLSLALARAQLERFFAIGDSKILGKPRPAPESRILRAALALERWLRPRGLAARCSTSLDRYERGDARPLESLLKELSELPRAVRSSIGPELAVEGGPWLDKVGEYGRVGLLALELESHPPDERSGLDRGRWEEAREKLRSANGLEILFELKAELNAIERWLRTPPERRPVVPELRLPGDPREML